MKFSSRWIFCYLFERGRDWSYQLVQVCLFQCVMTLQWIRNEWKIQWVFLNYQGILWCQAGLIMLNIWQQRTAWSGWNLVSFVILSSRELSRRSQTIHHQTQDIRKVRRTSCLVYTVRPELSPQCPAKSGSADHGNIFCKTWHLCYKTFQMWVKFKSNRHCQITLSGAAYDMIVLSRGPLLPLHIKLTNVTRGNFLHGLVDFTGCPKKGGISVQGTFWGV